MANVKIDIAIVYDGECPFCADFMLAANMRKAGYALELVSAREKSHPKVLLARNFGLDLDYGMVVFVGDRILYGADAANFIVMHGDQTTFRGKVYRLLLSNSTVAKIFYPMLVFLRKVFFFITRRRLINE
jgi:predicted DCC family thiol-disulfide oxidoreductase YuxK